MMASFKHSEVGVIPEDWNAVQLPDVVWFQEGPGLRKWQFRSKGLKVINVTNLQENGCLDVSTTERHISWEEFERTYRHFMVDDGDIVMASSGNSYCKTAIVRPQDLPLLMNTSVIRFKAKHGLSKRFMFVYLKSKYLKDQIDLMITGGAQPNFGPFHLKKILIPLPPTNAEQETIAEVLSDVDALIASLEQSNTKRRYLKQGAMQELLTGKKRLPGFDKQWSTGTMGDCFELISTRNEELNDNVVTISAQLGFIRQEEFFNKRVASKLLGNYYLIKKGDFAYNRSYSNGYPMGAIKRLKKYEKGVVTTLYICFSPKNEARCDPGFFEHYFEAGLMNAGLSIVANEGGRAHGLLNVTKADFLTRELKYPSLMEQTAITEVLSDMDAEIEALEVKLAKVCALKQGMMQELLTGRIRLV
jgi:type I restriction enzyme S subunit